MSNGEADVLSKIGVVAATTAQVETSVIERMQKKLKEQNLASLKEEMHDIQKSLDQYSDSKKIFEAKSEKDIDDPAGKLLFKNYKKLQKLQLEYASLLSANTHTPQPQLEKQTGKRRREVSLPGNVQKKPRLETEQERQIRTGKITPFAQLRGKTTVGNSVISRINNINVQNKKTQQITKPKIKQSSLFKPKEVTTNNIMKKRKEKNENKKNVKRRKRSNTIAEPVPDFLPEKNNVILQGGYKLPKSVFSKLFEHQKTSVKWLWELYRSEVGGIIADEMGLGKTVQIVSFLAGIHYSNMNQLPSIIVCPTTIMIQWKLEFQKWWPHLRVEILHSSECNDFSELLTTVVSENGVIITSYGTLQVFRDEILPIEFEIVVLDEGHKIRNPDSQVTMVCKQLRSPNRIILTGAPIQNNLQELWSLFDFIFPGKLGTLPVFKEQFETPIRVGGYSNAKNVQVQTAYKCAVVLRDEINPFLLRRMKEDVDIGLPDKSEQVLFCPLLPEQKKVYAQFLESDIVSKVLIKRGNLLAATTTLRKICNHPDLLREPGDEPAGYGHHSRSGKMSVLAKLLPLWKEEKHRCLLFTQTRRVLDMLENFANEMGFTYLRMDGNTPVRQRQELIETYQNDESIFLFIMTTKTGGIGVNLTRADRVILYDPDWNPTTDIQARERAWRIGQLNSVTIYRLITSGTIEEKIYQRQIYKQFLSNKILKDPRQKRLFHSRILKDLFSLEDPEDGITETCDLFSQSYVNMETNMDDEEDDDGDDNSLWESNGKQSELESLDDVLEKVQEEMDKNQKRNILADVLSSTGVRHVLSHDSIVDNSGQESVLVEHEATVTAKKAAAALRKSVKECMNTAVHVPTWTGNNSSVQSTPKRFGNVKNYRTSPSVSSPLKAPMPNIKNYSPQQQKDLPLTWGSMKATDKSSTSSSSILDNLRNLNKKSLDESNLPEPDNIGSVNKKTNFFQSSPASSSSPSSSKEIISKLKHRSAAERGNAVILVDDQNTKEINSISKRLHRLFEQNSGEVSSKCIVKNFCDITSEKEKLFFRNLLKNISTLDKKKRVWILNKEYKKA